MKTSLRAFAYPATLGVLVSGAVAFAGPAAAACPGPQGSSWPLGSKRETPVHGDRTVLEECKRTQFGDQWVVIPK